MRQTFLILVLLIPVLVASCQEGKKVSKYVSDGDTLTDVTDTTYIRIHQIGVTKETKALRLKPLFDAVRSVFTTSEAGRVPASGGGTTNYLRADGSWAVPPGTGGGSPSDSSSTSYVVDTLYFGSHGSGVYILIDGDTMRLNSNTISGLTLNQIKLGYNAAVRDAIPASGAIRMLADTVTKISWVFTDSAQFKTTRWMAWYYHGGPDTLAITGSIAAVPDGSPNYSYNWCYGSTMNFSSGFTKVWTTDLVVTGTDATTGGEVDDTPNNPSIPPGNYVFLRIYDDTALPVNGTSFNLQGYEY